MVITIGKKTTCRSETDDKYVKVKIVSNRRTVDRCRQLVIPYVGGRPTEAIE